MKIKTIVPNLNPQMFIKQFVNAAHILFRELEYNVESLNGGTVTVKLGEKNKDLDRELQVTCIPGHERDQTYIILDVLPAFGFRNLVNPTFSVAAWLHNTYRCTDYTDIDSGKDVNILGRTGGSRMSVHNTSDTPMRHDLGVFNI